MQAVYRLLPSLPCCAAGLFFWAASSYAFGQAPVSTSAETPISIADVIIKGSESMSPATVSSYLKTRVGDPFNDETVREDVRTLVATKLFADVRAQVENLSESRVNIYFILRDLPATIRKLEYRGAKHLKDEELNLLTDLRVGRALSPTKNKLACQAIVRKYNDDGRPFADCVLVKGGKPGDCEVVFQITEGPRVKIGDIQFTGSHFVSGDVLATHINSSKLILGVFSGEMNKDMIEGDVGRLSEYYRSFGFHDVNITHEVRYHPEGRNAVVVFHITEGPRYRIKDRPIVVGVKPETAEHLKKLCNLKPLEHYNGPALERVARSMEDYLGYAGFDTRVQVSPIWSKDEPGVVTVQFEVDNRR